MKKIFVALFSLAVAAGCGSSAATQGPDPIVDPIPNPSPTVTTLSGSIPSDLTVVGDVLIADDVTVQAGATLTLGSGSVKAVANKNLIIKGKLVATGTAAAPVKFLADGGQTAPGWWGGITLAGAGTATIAYAEIHGANLAFQATGTGSYSLDHLLIDTSLSGLILNSTGTVTKSVIHGNGAGQGMSLIVITSASPQLTDVKVDGANPGVDLVVVSGNNSSPLFDHVDISQSHCGFHINGGVNITVSNSNIHDNVFAMMAEGSVKTTLKLDNIYNNSAVNVGSCFAPGTVALAGNYYGGTITAPYDSSCLYNPADSAPSSSLLTTAGFRP